MKVKLIMPGWRKNSFWGQMSFKFPSLSLVTLAAYTPAEIDISITDENVEPLDFDEPVDLVGITVMTPLAVRAYEIADGFRQRGAKVVLGGFHPTWMTQEALLHADAVVVGEGERSWGQLLKDMQQGRLQRIYRSAEPFDMARSATPRRELLDGKKYLFTNTIQITRGCPYACEFCSVSSFFGRHYRMKPVDTVIGEIAEMAKEKIFVFFVDDNIIFNKDYAETLFRELAGIKVKWLSHASLEFAGHPKLLKLAAESGCIGMFVGVESLNEENLLIMGKKTNRKSAFMDSFRMFHNYGIGVLASFVLGYDHDRADSFDGVLEFCHKAKIDSAIFPVLTPFPGTAVRKRLMSENRLISSDWKLYDMEHVTFVPKLMTPAELQEGFEKLNSQFFSPGSIFKRLFKLKRSNQVFLPMNIGFRSAWKKSR